MLDAQIKAKQIIQELPPTAQDELLNFLDYLRYKYQIEEKMKTVQLGGLWSDLDFDVSDKELRHFRQQTTSKITSNI